MSAVGASGGSPLLAVRSLTKLFGSFAACNAIDLDIQPGERVTIVGNGTPATAGAPTIDDLAALTGTISYELTCGWQARLPKLYIQGGSLVAIADLFGYREF